MYIQSPEEIYNWISSEFERPRSIVSSSTRSTLRSIEASVHDKYITKWHSFQTGTRIFDWTVPKEWNFQGVVISDLDGHTIFKSRRAINVVVGSLPLATEIRGRELLIKSFIGPSESPDRIPYVTSYYKEDWGLCLSHNQSLLIEPDKYYLLTIDVDYRYGKMSMLECILPGKSKEEVLFSTYCCHPEMANNELSGPGLLIALANSLATSDRPNYYTYRFLFTVETIGALAFLKRRGLTLKRRMRAGFVVTCVGSTVNPVIIHTKTRSTYADTVALLACQASQNVQSLSHFERGSDERQFCSPFIDLPVASIVGNKYGQYPEYHTSDDNLSLVNVSSLRYMLDIYKRVITILEGDGYMLKHTVGEPFMTKYGLISTTSYAGNPISPRLKKHILHYGDGTTRLTDLAMQANLDILDVLNTGVELSMTDCFSLHKRIPWFRTFLLRYTTLFKLFLGSL